jgi:hypothetical protein
MYEYKVLTERDRRFSGRFDPATLEATLNTHAQQGWRLVQAAPTANTMKTSKAEIVLVLERRSLETEAGRCVT